MGGDGDEPNIPLPSESPEESPSESPSRSESPELQPELHFRKVRFIKTSSGLGPDERINVYELQVWVNGTNIASRFYPFTQTSAYTTMTEISDIGIFYNNDVSNT